MNTQRKLAVGAHVAGQPADTSQAGGGSHGGSSNDESARTRGALPLEDSPHLLDEHGPVFVMGCPRSGTTFLSGCLAVLEAVEEFAGVLVPPRMMHLLAFQSASGPSNANDVLLECVRDTFWQAHWRRRLFRSERVLQVLAGHSSPSSLLGPANMSGSLFAFKEPTLCFAAPEFAREFPNARFIHIIRDGRDNADSLGRTYPHALSDEVLRSETLAGRKNTEIGLWRKYGEFCVPWWVPVTESQRFVETSQYGRCVWLWRAMVERARQFGASEMGRSRYLEFRYEDLVNSPNAQGERLLAFLQQKPSRRFARALTHARVDSVRVSARHQSRAHLAEAEELAGGLLRELRYI